MSLAQLHERARHLSAQAWCDAFVQVAAGGDDALGLPGFPPDDIQRITNSQTNASTMRSAADFYRILDETIASQPGAAGPLLDFGAGWGRITRLLLRSLPPQQITAVDVDARLVEAGNALLPEVQFMQIGSGEALPFADASFATVISNSVFSHLSAAAQAFYVAEIARILRPGGLFVGTTLSARVYRGWLEEPAYRQWITELLGPAEAVTAALARGEVAYASSGRWPDYGIALLPDGYVEQHWGRYFAGIAVREDYKQDVNIALKPA